MVNTQATSTLVGKLDPILWVGREFSTSISRFFPFQKREVEIVSRASFSEALEALMNGKFSVVIAEEDEQGVCLNFLVQAKNLQPLAPRLLIVNELNENRIRQGINLAQVFKFLSAPISEKELWSTLEKALSRHVIFLSRSILLRESSSQNKELEALTHSLEAIVEERTHSIEQSHREEEEKLNRERQLIRFIKDLATQNSFEEVLGILRKELRKFHKIGDPILAYRLVDGHTFFLSFQLDHFTKTESENKIIFPKSAQSPDSHFVREFANHFGRPFAKIYAMPLELRLTSHLFGENAEAILCIENFLNEKELPPFLDHIADRMRPLSMALDRILLENQLSIFSYRWEKTFDGMRDPIAILDENFEVIRSNKKFLENTSSHKCFQDFAHFDSPCEGCPVGNALVSRMPQVGQIQVKDRVYQVHSYPILIEEGGQPKSVVNQYVDITKSRELYLQMLQSEKMGAIGMLAGNIAHELNNPLTGLRSLAQVLLLEVDKEGNLFSDLVEIEKATARSQRIIKNLLEFSRGEEQPAEFISVDEIIERTLPMLKSAMRIHRLEVDLQALGVSVFVEPNLLQQVIFNIINNACQAMKTAGRLSISTWAETGKVVTEICDSGPGIPAEIQKKIFEPFFTTKKEGQGTGLGLSMSKTVIEKFGGTIEFSSVHPQGTCFRIVLPQANME